jgi:hypothetical protein
MLRSHTQTSGDSFTPCWLTGQLQQAGVLPQGRVVAVRSRANAAFNSRLTHLELDYSVAAPAAAPRRLVAKQSLPEPWAVTAGLREVEFYRSMASLPAPLPGIVPCYAALHDPQTGHSILLLQDLSDSHAIALPREQQLSAGANIPSEAAIDQVIDALARFHASWWEPPRLGNDPAFKAWRAESGQWEQHMQRVSRAWRQLRSEEGASLPEETVSIYEHALGNLPRLWEAEIEPRFRALSRLTVTHGDAYFANFLVPNEPWSAPTYLIDWQCPWVDWGPLDLVPLCAAFWTPAQRQKGEREMRMLHRYHEALQQAGVENYSWENLLHDYRLALIDWLLVPIQDRDDGAGREYWRPKMACLSAAYLEWECAALLAA